ncbi:nucleotide exchange factor GrpE [candidate division WOR-1 bacterium RIFOXYD2_FULL_36_8]|uniref:Protein GrpE n=1 Tax=candidate division WOR-1 bacterium RIFOXYB2_FULL_36_35 TaxID=1802578 RepID=A0A1F4S8P2_UNCSA|nr:MAG: nucleotide exchange factor GrpE [candidate division WOR-1 bacterium RIFOXYA2_FULL_36_21]OGC16818.1 MAG: nucleotide exchange factor GrpE [candidate division WOR-1 bacterium RIFOXYB2_FULL_36_35]OGC16961.1 MAG: nucleotide exchange factor GrpE [candidate division WOR-1 bacterium RIFOXYA12_FULL_36_13]OGC41284.1 MAG: nucleotide exchange factor GrpE [candidate division WOR-1 bacterium RIFOXYD2_FULL_36_8]
METENQDTKNEPQVPNQGEGIEIKDELETFQGDLEALKDEINKKEDENKELKNKLLRTLADFDNYKKRIAKEKEELIKFGNETLVFELLPVLDCFEHAIAAAKKSNDENIILGIELVKKQMIDTFKKLGVFEVEAIDKPYDPHFHEAMSKQESDKPENTVICELRKGYTLNGKLVRPAMVIVSEKK